MPKFTVILESTFYEVEADSEESAELSVINKLRNEMDTDSIRSMMYSWQSEF